MSTPNLAVDAVTKALAAIQPALTKFDYSAKLITTAVGAYITIDTKKGETAGFIKSVNGALMVEQRYVGKRNMMGSVAQRALEAAIAEVR